MSESVESKVMGKWQDVSKRREKQRQYYLRNKQRLNAYRRKRYAENQEVRAQKLRSSKKYYEKNREERLRYHKRYAEECKERKKAYRKKFYIEHREELVERSLKWKRQNRDKARTHGLVYSHKIPIGNKCVLCSSSENLVRHHPDYSKPLEVVTLCSSCHSLLHNRGVLP